MSCCPLFSPAHCAQLCSAVSTQLLVLRLGFWAPLWLSWCGGSLPVLRAVQVLLAGLCSLEQQCLGLSRAGTGHSHCSQALSWCQAAMWYKPGPTLCRGSQEKWQTFSVWPCLCLAKITPPATMWVVLNRQCYKILHLFFCSQDRIWQKKRSHRQTYHG